MKIKLKGRYIALIGIALLGLLIYLPEPRDTLIKRTLPEPLAVWYGIWQWQGLKTEQLHPIVLDLAASEDPKKLAFAALLGASLEQKEIDKEVKESSQNVVNSETFEKPSEDNRDDTSKLLDDAVKYVKKREEIEEKREKEGRRVIAQETLNSWQKMALEKAAADDVWVFSMLANFGSVDETVREQAIVRWQQAEPENLAPLLHQQGLSANELFERSKTRHQFIEYNYPILRWMYQTLLQQRPNQQKNIATELIGIDTATSIILTKPLLDVCKKNPPEQASENWHSCRFIAQTLRQSSGSSAIPPLIGTSILQTLANDENEKQIFHNERAYLGWLINKPSQHIMGVRFAEKYLKRLQDENINSEQQAIESFLLQEGLPLKPDEESLKPFLEKYKQ